MAARLICRNRILFELKRKIYEGRAFSQESLVSFSRSFSFHSHTVRPWSIDHLTELRSVEDHHYLLKEVIQDLTIRLERQNSIILSLEGILKSEEDKQKEILLFDKAYKTIRDLQYLHTDTQRKCEQLLTPIQQNSSIDKLFLSHISKVLEEIHTRHSLIMEALAEMVIQVRPLLSTKVLDSWNDCIMILLQSKIGLQLLADHGSQLAKKEFIVDSTPSSSTTIGEKVGAISINAPVADIIQQAKTEAKHLCEAHYLTSPPVLSLQDVVNDNESPPIVTCVRPWIHYALFEIFKNSMTITIERKQTNHAASALRDESLKVYGDDDDDDDADDDDYNESLLDPIYTRIVESSKHIQIQVTDQGGGTEEEIRFTFCQTQKIWDRLEEQQTYAMTRSPLKGLGVGLSLANLYLRHFGGSLTLENSPSVGMTATLKIPKDTSILEREIDTKLGLGTKL